MNTLRQQYPNIKPNTLVSVSADGYSYIGEVMSYPIPNEGGEPTVMVRRAPGHPGTLDELPISKLAVVPGPTKAKQVHYAKIVPLRGVYFPVDMLRREAAAPVNFRINDEDKAELIDSTLSEDLVIAKVSSRRQPDWCVERWRSFGFVVIHLNTTSVEG